MKNVLGLGAGRRAGLLALAVVAAFVLAARPAEAHCDTLDGPVVRDARTALESGDVSPVLKWVRAERETEVRDAFARAREVRRQGEAARDLADRFFFETLVRVHRKGEGAAFAGLKPAGLPLEPGVRAAEAAIASGSPAEVVALVARAAEDGLRARLARLANAKAREKEGVEAGRAWVAAYVDLVHYAERLAADASAGAAEEHGGAVAPAHVH